MLTVDSARSSCMRSVNGNAGTPSDMGMGATSGSGEGMTSGSGKSKRMHHRSKHRKSHGARTAAEAQHQTDKANGNQ